MGGPDASSFAHLFSVEKSSHVVDSACARLESLAAIKDLRWFCTSWISPTLSVEEGDRLYSTLYNGAPKEGSDGGLCENSLYIGSSTITRAKVYCVFPHLKRDIRYDSELLEKWHDLVIRPAFEQSWRQGWEGSRGIPKIPKTFKALKAESQAAGKKLHERNPKRWPEPFSQPMEEEWPSEFLGGTVHKWDECLDLAWKSMCDSVEDNQDLYELQDMFLVTTIPGFPKGGRTTQEAFQIASKHWECSIEPAYVDTSCFKVFYKTNTQIGVARSRFWSGYFS